MNMTTKISFGILAFTFLFLFYIGWLMFAPIKAATVSGTKILTPEIKAGGTLIYTIDYCKYVGVEGISYRSIVDGYVVNYAPQTSNTPKGCGIKKIELTIPAFLDTGEYRIYTIFSFQVNPLRKETVEYMTDPFLVVGK